MRFDLDKIHTPGNYEAVLLHIVRIIPKPYSENGSGLKEEIRVTRVFKPVSSVGSFNGFVVVVPLKPGCVSVISSSTEIGSSIAIGMSSETQQRVVRFFERRELVVHGIEVGRISSLV